MDVQRTDEFTGNDRFQLIRRLGAGGMGVVWEALDREHGRKLALKTLRTFAPDALSRFKNEFRALQDLHHENLVGLGELFEHAGHWFFTMELVEGVDFLRWVRAPVGDDDSTADGMPTAADTAVIVRGGAGGRPVRVHTPGARVDELKLRAALGQLARGVHALHVARKVHRDLKPSNVLVTGDGRVVILDFGLITGAGQQTDGKLVGTVAFMSPEQAALGRIAPASDWYSVGVMLYLALTGRLPFDGEPEDVIVDKQRIDPIPPLAIAPDVPRDLDRLCMDLLRIHPEARPSGTEVLQRLDVDAMSLTAPAPFVGRLRELDELEAAYRGMRGGSRTVVCIRGESGVGKSALATRFADLVADRDGAVVLAGRCYERESVPYKGVDGIVDALSAYLDGVGDDAALLLPRDAPLLTRLFPQLGRVRALADTSGPRLGEIEAQELRIRVFEALRELFKALSTRVPLLLVVDDFQWAGADSRALLDEVLRAPHAPAVLLVTTVRSDVETPIAPGALAGEARLIELEGLPAGDARALAEALLGRVARERPHVAAAIADDAKGHPLFIDALARNSRAGSTAAPSLKLEQALIDRVSRLDPTTRRLVEVVVVAGSPIQQSVAAQVAGLELSEVVEQLATLRAAHLIRTRGGRASDAIEPYHDRVRAAVLQCLDENRAAALHRQLALALEANAGQADLEAISLHWQAVGEPARAARWAVSAAEQASEALAFDRAARLYQLALELRPNVDEARSLELHVRLAEALGNAGRGPAAAEAYLAAAKLAQGARARELERRAAEHLLCSGHVDAGLKAIERVLDGVGLRLPGSPERAVASLLLLRARIRLRGPRVKLCDASTIPPEQLERIDTTYSVASGLGLVDVMRAAAFQARHILLALEAGEPARAARAFALESIFAASAGGRGEKRATLLCARAEEIARGSKDPRAEAWVIGSVGFNALQWGRWRQAADLLAQAETILRERCTGVGWELATAQIHRLMALSVLGELPELAIRGRRYLREADDRGDLFASTMFRLGPLPTVWLAEGDIEGGRRDAQQALRHWSNQAFQLQHLYGMTARAQYALYTGEGAGAYRIIEQEDRGLRRSQLLRFHITRLMVRELRIRSLITWAQASAGSARGQLLSRAESELGRLEREGVPWANALARLQRSGIAMLRDRTDRALALLTRAEQDLAAVDMSVYEAVARMRRGELIGGDQGKALVDDGRARLVQRGVREPRRVVDLCAPGFRS